MARGQNRRRVDRRSHGAPRGAGLRRFGLWLALGALSVGAGAGGLAGARALRRSHAFSLRTIRFAGLTHATADELLALSPAKPGDDLLSVDAGAVEAALSRHPWIRRVEVRRRWPPSLEVKVSERRAEALVELSGLYLVDEEANVFKRAAAGDGLDLPVITGIARADYLLRRSQVEPLLSGALALVRAWRTDGWDEVAPLAEIHVDADGTTLYLGSEGTEVRLGSGDLKGKLSRLEKVLSALRAEGKRAGALYLDNRLHPSFVAVDLATGEPKATEGER